MNLRLLLPLASGLFLSQLVFSQNDRSTGIPAPGNAQQMLASPMSALRSVRGQASEGHAAYYVTDAGRQGFFVPDVDDRTTADDSSMTLVTAAGIRLKRVIEGKMLNVSWFGATGNGVTDDWGAIQKGIDYILNTGNSVRTLYFPPGMYRITRPLLIARLQGNGYLQVSINLEGPANFKDLSTGGAIIAPTFNNTFAIGIQLGKGVEIKDLMVRGTFKFPDNLNEVQVDTLSFAQWTDGSARDNQRSPYAGIVIDPFSDSTAYPSRADMYPGLHHYYPAGMDRGGSTAVQIIGCMITNFIVGVMITPSNQWNGEVIDVIDCDISSAKVAYAMGQAQSKECHVNRLKCWSPVHTVFDNVSYGFRHGDGAAVPMVDGANIAGFVKQLCNIQAAAFSGVFRNIYAEGLFRIGNAGGRATLSFEDCQLDFSTQMDGLPYPDFYVLGSGATFHNCMLRHYGGRLGTRLVLSGCYDIFDGGVMNEPPVAINLDVVHGNGVSPTFGNVVMYYLGGVLGYSNRQIIDVTHASTGLSSMKFNPVYFGNTVLLQDLTTGGDVVYKFTYDNTYERVARLSGIPRIHVDKRSWTAWFKLATPGDTSILRRDDIVLTTGQPFEDQFTGSYGAVNPVGFIERIDHDTVRLRNLGLGIHEGEQVPLWADYYVTERGPLTGDLDAGSNVLRNVDGELPMIGDRLDAPFLRAGTYVTAVDAARRAVSFSNVNNSGKSFSDYTILNGYPRVEMHSAHPLPVLQKNQRTLVGGAEFFLHELPEKDEHNPAYLLGSDYVEKYRNWNTHFAGDTTMHKLRFTPMAR